MFVSKNQFYIFVACVAFGGIAGVVFSIASIFKLPFKNKILLSIPDILSFIVVVFLYVFISDFSRFPTIRFYMPLGVLIGLYLYFKSFNIILAKSAEKIYNIFKSKKVKRKHDRIKIQKAGCCGNSRRNNTSNNIDIRNDLSVSVNKR